MARGYGGGSFGGYEFGEWLERERAAKELRSALHDVRARGEELGMDLDTLDLPSARKSDLAQMSPDEIRAAADDLRAEIRSAEREWFYDITEDASASELVEALLDLVGNKANKKALRDRLNAESSDIMQLAEELLDIDNADREYFLNADTRDKMREQRAAEQSLLRSGEFMAKVEEGAKNWIGG